MTQPFLLFSADSTTCKGDCHHEENKAYCFYYYDRGCYTFACIDAWRKEKQPATGFAAHRVIAHAMGGINDKAYTNTKDAFIANYEQGTRIFEADLLLTSDEQLVARHEWTTG